MATHLFGPQNCLDCMPHAIQMTCQVRGMKLLCTSMLDPEERRQGL